MTPAISRGFGWGIVAVRAADPLITGLISYWKLDESSDGSGAVQRNDSHGTNHLTDNNTTASGTGRINNGIDLVSTNSECLSITSNATLQTGDIDFTIAAWAKLDAKTANRVVAGKWNGGTNEREWLLYWSSAVDRFVFLISADGGATTYDVFANNLGSPTIGNWYFIVGWHDAVNNTINIQVNNGTVDSEAHTLGLTALGGHLNIGATNNETANFLDGIIDEVGFWKRVLTSGERTRLFNGGAGLQYPF